MGFDVIMQIGEALWLNRCSNNINEYNEAKVEFLKSILSKIKEGYTEIEMPTLNNDFLDVLFFISGRQVQLLRPVFKNTNGEEYSYEEYVNFLKTYRQGDRKKVDLSFKKVNNPKVFIINKYYNLYN